jgi:hypothetical protein
MRWWDQLGVIGEGLSVIGFGFTIWQLFKTKKAAVAAQEAAQRVAQSHLSKTRRTEVVSNLEVLQTIPESTRKVMTKLPRSFRQADDLLRSWRQHGQMVCEHRKRLDGGPDPFLSSLEKSFRAAEEFRGLLLTKPDDHASLARALEGAVLEMEGITYHIPFQIKEQQLAIAAGGT